MSCHIKECVLDFGPLLNFWLFALERFNAILGQLPNNNRTIEVQMLRRFLSDGELFQFFLNEFHDESDDFISFKTAHVGTIGKDYSLLKKDVKLPHCSTRCVRQP